MLFALQRRLLLAFFVLQSLCFTWLGSPAMAVELPFQVIYSSSEIPLNQTFELTFKIVGSNYKDLDFPSGNDDYQVIGQSSKSNIQYINGNMRQEREIRLSLRMKHTGKITLPAAKVELNGKAYMSNPITVTVRGPSQAGLGSASAPVNPSAGASDSVYVVAELSKTNPYINEQILYKLKIYHIGNLKDLNIPALDIDGFSKERIENPLEYQAKYKGQEYLVYELDYILFPLRSGSLHIPSIEIISNVYEMDPNFDPLDPFSMLTNNIRMVKPRTLRANSISVNVRTLPGGAPKGFTGYVGTLNAKTSVDKFEVEEGEAISLSTSLSGDGNLRLFDLDDLIEEGSSYSVFKDTENFSTSVKNRIKYSSLSSKLALVPKKHGTLELELKPFVNFNPASGQYESHGSKKLTIAVKKSTKENDLSTYKPSEDLGLDKKLEVKATKEILDVSIERTDNYRSLDIPWLYGILAILLLNLIPILGYLFGLAKNKGSRMMDDRNKKFNFGKIKKQIHEAQSLADVSVLLKEALSKLRNGRGHLDSEKESKVEEFFNKLDQGNYGRASLDIGSLKEESISLLKELRANK